MSHSFDLDNLISVLDQGNPIAEQDVVFLLQKIMEVLYLEPTVLELQSPITICGDIHGQLYDLFELFDCCSEKDSEQFLFLGDYVDRGYYSFETIFYLFALKLKYPGHFWLLRGNHECRQVNEMYGFYNEAQTRYDHTGVWTLCNDVFDLLPMAAIVDGRVFAVHGGLSPFAMTIEAIGNIPRNSDLPESGPLADLCWSDPDDAVDEWLMNSRGAGWLFGGPQVEKFLRLNGDLQFVTRSHQLAMAGYQWFFNKKLVTVWSAPNYMYRSGNKASVMKYRKELGIDSQIKVFSARAQARRKKPLDASTSPYFI
jgi:diadenosine tetraphosphatase ApaH/serine/threonine PP2A family protein phosphatase